MTAPLEKEYDIDVKDIKAETPLREDIGSRIEQKFGINPEELLTRYEDPECSDHQVSSSSVVFGAETDTTEMTNGYHSYRGEDRSGAGTGVTMSTDTCVSSPCYPVFHNPFVQQTEYHTQEYRPSCAVNSQNSTTMTMTAQISRGIHGSFGDYQRDSHCIPSQYPSYDDVHYDPNGGYYHQNSLSQRVYPWMNESRQPAKTRSPQHISSLEHHSTMLHHQQQAEQQGIVSSGE